MQLTLHIPDDLAAELRPREERLPRILRLGLRELVRKGRRDSRDWRTCWNFLPAYPRRSKPWRYVPAKPCKTTLIISLSAVGKAAILRLFMRCLF